MSALFVMSGCGGEEGPKGPVGTVSGKVTFKGAPVPAGCVVTFQGSAKSTGAGAGAVGSDGTYSLRSGGSDKIPAGQYIVTVSPPPVPPTDPKVLEEYMQTGDESKLPKAPPSPFPAKYSDASASGVKLEVKEGKNSHDITLAE